jgi:[acyl-carrier-protein] S-malonyltransferase
MKTALVFPGQGSQFPGMGKDLYDASEMAREMFHKANEILGFDIAKVMFEGTQEDLKKTSVTQPAIYIHSVALARVLGMDAEGHMAAGHSLGEFSALAVAGALSFEDGLRLVSIRANAMQKACNAQQSTMAAVIGMEDAVVEAVCAETGEVVVPANYNSPGQLVISGTMAGVEKAIELLKARGARLVKPLVVDGAFHSPVMEPARAELAEGIASTPFNDARIPVYQNATATAETTAAAIRQNLIAQLTAPVRWTQSVERMVADGASRFIEIGPGNVLQGLVKRIAKEVTAEGRQSL